MTGAEITRIREAAGLSKSGLARLLGNTYRTVLRWEDGTTPPIVPRSAEIVLELLDRGELPARYLNEVPTTGERA